MVNGNFVSLNVNICYMTNDSDYLKIFIVDDSEIFRDWLNQEFKELEGVKITGLAANVKDGIQQILATKPDVAILDLALTDGHGLQILHAIQNATLDTKVYFFSNYPTFKVLALNNGAAGFFDKSKDAQELIKTIRSLLKNKSD